jgi:hypothetical protein
MDLEILSRAPIHLVITGSVVALLAVSFIVVFVPRALRRLVQLHMTLRALEGKDLKDLRDPLTLDKAFPRKGEIAHLWLEYKKTLYAVPEETSDGIANVRWTSTAPAEVIWNSQLAVDQCVDAEFFKHLPGLFTGLGIIGTFFGLIEGLRHFAVSSDANVVRGSLESLMHSVGEAFFISAVAITLAIAVTLIEKMLLAILYGRVDAIAASLDRRFQAAVAEKFLEMTVVHTEETATQLKHLKGELLKDLRPMLQELSDRHTDTLERLASSLNERFREASLSQIEAARDNGQALGATLERVASSLSDRFRDATRSHIDAARENTQLLGSTISEVITGSLAGPLDDIKNVVQQVSGDQSAAAIRMLQDVMTSFSQRLNDLFGGQISGINQLNQQTAQAMQDAVSKLNELVVSLQDAGKRSSDSMAEQMAKAITEMGARQDAITQNTQALVEQIQQAIAQSQKTTADGLRSSTDEMAKRMADAIEKMAQQQDSINERTREFVGQIKALIDSSQSETSAKLQSTLKVLGEQLGGMLTQFQSAQQAVLAAGQAREEQAAKSKNDAVAAIGTQTENFVGQVGKLLADSNYQSRNILQTTTDSMHSQVKTLLDAFQNATTETLEAGRKREEETNERTQSSVSQLMGSVDGLIGQIALASSSMAESVTALRVTTTSAISRLSDGAEQVNAASRNFSSASENVTGAMNQASAVTMKLTDLTTSLTVAASSLQQGVLDYKAHREAVSILVSDLNELVANAKTDVSITSDVLRRIEAAAKELGKAQVQTEQFMVGVATVLGKAHESFREAMLATVRENNHEFQQTLSSAVRLLATSIKELDDVLSSVNPQVRSK